mmetsp:Transcript_34564/g.55627  ORF Transcript_34564/g.55627 Transcript_34564/m.55627 type:complete len:103 (+) Transcript_34564:923-1231(+)
MSGLIWMKDAQEYFLLEQRYRSIATGGGMADTTNIEERETKARHATMRASSACTLSAVDQVIILNRHARGGFCHTVFNQEQGYTCESWPCRVKPEIGSFASM